MSRLRSNSKYPSRMVMSCNPDPDHIICKWITDAGYLDEDGYPIPEMDGVKRFMLRIDGNYVFGKSAEELKEKYGKHTRPISFSFISANIYDNPIMIETNPDYLSMLEGLPELEKAQLLYGNWKARADRDSYFKRSYLKECSKLPSNAQYVTAWDKAASVRSQSNKSPDFTACIHMAKDKNGYYYLYGDYAPTNYDSETETFGRFCKTAGDRDNHIMAQAEYDGYQNVIVLPKDPAAAGAAEFKSASKPLIEAGFKVKADPMPNNKSKLVKFMPFSTAAENGFIYIVKESFDYKTYNALMTELEQFDGSRSTTTRHDDWADACASAFNYLAQSKKQVSLNMVPIDNGTTMIDDFMRNLQQTRPTGR